MKTIDNLINQVEESSFSRWQWITALNYKSLGYSDDMLGCIEVYSVNKDQSEKKTILAHDDEFDDFFAIYGLLLTDQGGVLK